MTSNYYTFQAIRGQQGKHEYYVAQCPLRMVPRLFFLDERDIPEKLRPLLAVNTELVTDGGYSFTYTFLRCHSRATLAG